MDPAVVVRIHPGQLLFLVTFLRVRPGRGAVVLLLALLLTAADAAQARGIQPGPQEARRAQALFEEGRRTHLPWTLRGGGGCDERLGRMCMTHQGGGRWEPRLEPEEITRSREELLRALAGAAAAHPKDPWILGQRIRYLAEADRWEEAEALARACGVEERWLCRGLVGFALHGLGRYEEAGEAFRRTREMVPPEEKEDWEGLSRLLDRSTRRLKEGFPGPAGAFRERLWRLSDPYFLAPGNDRRTAHGARLVMAWLMEEARNPYGLGWGGDLEELLVRYGWEVGWERRVAGDGGVRPVVGHHDPRGRQWIPPAEILEDPSSTSAGAWIPEKSSPRSTYAPPYAPGWTAPDAQLVRLRREPGLLLVASFRIPTTASGGQEATDLPSPAGGPVPRVPPWALDRPRPPPRAGLFLVPVDEEEGELLQTRSPGRTQGVLTLRGPPGRYLASLEVLDPEERRGGWVRRGVRMAPLPPGVVDLSDLMVLNPGREPGNLDEALPMLASRASLASGGSVILAWEVYGLGARGEPLTYQVTLKAEDRGFFSRIGGWLGLVDDAPPLALSWTEESSRAVGPWFRAVSVDVPELDPGPYRLRVRLSTRGRDDLVAQRRVEVLAGGR